jgi:hypothetical protein
MLLCKALDIQKTDDCYKYMNKYEGICLLYTYSGHYTT